MKRPISPSIRSARNLSTRFGFCALLIAVGEIVLCFVGPLAFLQKPSLMLFPLYSTGMTQDQIERATEFTEKQLALTHSFAVVGHRFIVEYYVRTNPDFDRSKIKTVDFATARKIAGELGMRRFATGWIFSSADRCELSVSIWDLSDQGSLRRADFVSRDFEALMQGTGLNGQPLDFRGSLAIPTKGIGMTEVIVLIVFALQALVGILALVGKESKLFWEIVWAALSVLFLFNYIYATNANMDYMQRYIASTGQLRLAENTTVERFHAIARYVPSLLLLGANWVLHSLRGSLPPSPQPNDVSPTGRRLLGFISRWPLPLTMLSAGLFGLSFPSLVSLDGIGPLAWVALVPLLLVILAVRVRHAIFYGVYFGILQGLFINYWHGTYDYVTLHMISITMIVEYLAFMVVLVWLMRWAGKWGFVVAPFAWVVFDWARSIGTLGYPWGIAGTTQYRFLPFIQIASITGIWGLDFVVLFANASLAYFIAGRMLRWRWGFWLSLRRRRGLRVRRPLRRMLETSLPLLVCGSVLVASFATGGTILSRTRAGIAEAHERGDMNVVLVQPNVDPRKNPYVDNLDLLISLTDDAIRNLGKKPDLVAWPEGAFMLDLRYWTDPVRSDSFWGRMTRRFLDYQRSLGTWLVTGTQDHGYANEQGKRVPKNFNSSILLDPDGNTSDIYHKIRLVPFGEYFPLSKEKFKGLYDQFKKYDISDWGIGDQRVVFQHPKAPFSTPICFEDVFSDHVRRYVKRGAQLIVNMSNDYWSLTSVEGRQHGIFALFRAVENRRPLLRATASGYTLAVDATGQIQPGSPEQYTSGTLIAKVAPAKFPLTLYTRWGDWFPVLCAVVVGLFVLCVALAWILRRLALRVATRMALRTNGEDRFGRIISVSSLLSLDLDLRAGNGSGDNHGVVRAGRASLVSEDTHPVRGNSLDDVDVPGHDNSEVR